MARKTKTEPTIPSFGELTEKKLRSLGQKLDKLIDANGFKHGNLLRKHSDDPHALVWHLARHGLILQEVRTAGILRELSEYMPDDVDAADVLLVLRRLPPDLGVLDKGAARDWTMLTPGILTHVDDLLCRAYIRDRAALLAAREALSPNLQLAIDSVRRRAGEAIDAASSAAIHAHLVAQHCAHGLALNIDVPRIVDGARVECCLADTAKVIELAGLFGPPQAWDEGVLAWLLPRVGVFRDEADALSERALAGLRLASLTDLVYLFGDGWWRAPSLLRALDARTDSAASLFAAAARLCAEGTASFRVATPQLKKEARPSGGGEDDEGDEDEDDEGGGGGDYDDYDDFAGDEDEGEAEEPEIEEAPGDHERVRGLATVLTVVGIERSLAAGHAVPPEVDAHFDMRRVYDSEAEYVVRLRRAIAALGPTRAHAIVRAALAHEIYFGKALVICDLCFDPALVEEVFARVEAGAYGIDVDMIGLCDLAVVPLAAARAGSCADEKKAAGFREAILYILARASAAGASWDPALDEHIHLELVRFSYGGSKVDPILAMLDRLPPERYARVMSVNAPRCAQEPWRLVRALRADAPEELLDAVFAALVAGRGSVTGGSLGDRLRRLGAQVVAPLLRAFGDAPAENSFMREIERALDPAAFEAFRAGLGRAIETPGQELRRLAASVAGPKVRIYMLHREDEEPAADAVARIGGAPRGVSTDAVPSRRGEPMEHVITLDLAQLPELAARRPGLRSVSLYLPDPDTGESHEQGALVWRREEELAAAPGATEGAAALRVEAFDVPASIFGSGEGLEGAEKRVRSLVYKASGYANGGPLWLQDGEPGIDPSFLFQFDESLCSINLGDMGVMYVFAGEIQWQCH